jgi:two-component system response regulator HydG
VARSTFREDLYYRLNVVTLIVPPLSERGEDIITLVQHFAKKFAEKNRRQLDSISDECLALLRNYPWPGNVRELENAVERGIILMRGSVLSEKSLPLAIQKFGAEKMTAPAQASGESPISLSTAEKQLIFQTLEETEGNKSEAARRLGISRKTLQNKLNRYEEES